MPLPDHITVYPAHGAGSACGKNMSKETSDTLGNQKKVNYALAHSLEKEQFIKEITTGIAPPPPYFPKNVWMNKGVNSSIDEVISRGITPLKLAAFKALAEDEEYLVLDVRSPQEYTAGAIPGSWFIGLDGEFAPWVGNLIQDIDQKIILITPQGREKETVTRLARVGYDNAQGYLEGGFETWAAAGNRITTITNITAQDFIDGLENNTIKNAIDARKNAEYEAGHIHTTRLYSLSEIHNHIEKLNKAGSYHVHCAGGYRSVIFASIIKSYGINDIINVAGGYNAILKTNLKNQKIITTSNCCI